MGTRHGKLITMAKYVDKVLRVVSCPRCNGTARVKATSRSADSDIVLVRLGCTKCRLMVNGGFTTRRAMQLHDRRHLLIEKFSEASQLGQIALMEQIRELMKEEVEYELGIRRS
jgi:hypothetical protein